MFLEFLLSNTDVHNNNEVFPIQDHGCWLPIIKINFFSDFYRQLRPLHSSQECAGQTDYNTLHPDSSWVMVWTHMHENGVLRLQKRYLNLDIN